MSVSTVNNTGLSLPDIIARMNPKQWYERWFQRRYHCVPGDVVSEMGNRGVQHCIKHGVETIGAFTLWENRFVIASRPKQDGPHLEFFAGFYRTLQRNDIPVVFED